MFGAASICLVGQLLKCGTATAPRSPRTSGRLPYLRGMADSTCGLMAFYSMLAIIIAALWVELRRSQNRLIQEEVARRGAELEAEVLARYEAGALEGSSLAKARQSQMASWDPLELELRYVLEGRELERLVLAHSPRLRAILETARQQIRWGDGVSHEDFWREVEAGKPGKQRRKSKGKAA